MFKFIMEVLWYGFWVYFWVLVGLIGLRILTG